MTSSFGTASLPSTWRWARLKHVAAITFSSVDKHTLEDERPVRLCNYVDVYKNERITSELAFMSASATDEEIRRFQLRAGDVLITKDSETWNDIGVPAVVDTHLDVLCGYHLALIRPSAGVLDGRYLARALEARGIREQFHVEAKGITRFGLSIDGVASARVPVPSISEQRAIADFLDRETARIDAVVLSHDAMAAALHTEHRARTNDLVTAGVRTEGPLASVVAKMRDSLPVGWILKRLKHISPRLGVGVVVNPSTYVSLSGLPFLYGGNIREGRVLADEARRISEEDSKMLPQSRLKAGDIVVVRVGAPGIAAVVPSELEGANCASVLLVRGSRTFNSDWLCYAINSRFVRWQVELVQYGAAQEQFNVGHAVDFWIPTPPRTQQDAIADELNRSWCRLDDSIAKIQSAIARLREYRSALITAAVTGQIDVRSAAGFDGEAPNSSGL